MKKILLILIFAIMSMSTYSQKIPTVNAHITSQQYQIDEFVSLGGKIYRAKSVTSTTPPGVDWADITQEGAQGGAAIVILDEGNGNGYVPFASDRANYGNVGGGAFDLSGWFAASTTHGATGDFSFAMGYGNKASGYGAFSMGEESIASGTYSFTNGYQNTASAYASMVTGAYNNNDGNYNFMGGVSNESGGGGAFYWGVALDGTGGDEMTFLGRANIRPQDSGGNLYYLVVGNGTTTGNASTGYSRLVPSDAFRVYRTGRIEAPSFESNMVLGDYDLTPKAYVDEQISGAAALQGKYKFSTAITATDPGTGKVSYNSATLALVSSIYINKITDENGSDASNWLDLLNTGDILYVQTGTDATEFISVTLTGPSVDNTGWFTLPVLVNDSGILHSNNAKISVVLVYTNGASPSGLSWEYTTAQGIGDITKNNTTWLHDFTGSVNAPANDWTRNTFLGVQAGNYTNGGIGYLGSLNVGIGAYALNGLTIGIQNNMIGNEAGAQISSGGGNNGMGDGILYNLTIGSYNTAIGKNALQNIISANENIAIGHNSGFYWGPGTGNLMTTGTNHIMIGQGARPSANGTNNEIVIGQDALGKGSNSAQIGSDNTKKFVFGDGEFKYQDSTLSVHSAVIDSVLVLNFNAATHRDGAIMKGGYPFIYTSDNGKVYPNTFVGLYVGGDGALHSSGDGGNTGFGTYSLSSLTTGGQNTSIGGGALAYLTSGQYNTAVGSSALFYATGSNNTAVGRSALTQITTGSLNTAIGKNAGWFFGSGVGLFQTGTNNILVGQDTRVSADGAVKQIVIGDKAIGKGDNTAIIGGSTNTDVYLTGEAHFDGFTLSAIQTAPASAVATGTAGEVRVTATHIYVCTATDTWVRTPLTTW